MSPSKRRVGLRQTGFTLLELLIVIAIIGLFAAISIGSLTDGYSSARDAKRFAEVRNIVNALELYYADYGKYPCGFIGEGSFSTPPNGTIDIALFRGDVYGGSWGPNFLDGLVGVTGSGLACIGEPKYGLVTAGYLPGGVTGPEAAGGYYTYVYHATQDRQGYLLTVTLEDDPDAMQVDNGPRDCALEVSGGTVQITNYNYHCIE
jgi:prepilin-type N-terminal cleavage/methylation domain-containing protein